jgi:hypothetical protein
MNKQHTCKELARLAHASADSVLKNQVLWHVVTNFASWVLIEEIKKEEVSVHAASCPSEIAKVTWNN